jgi:CheY-like chemotaxis protein
VAVPIRILLVDDEPDLLTLLSMRFELEGDLEVVATASDGAQAVDRALELRPDVVVMDLMMPGTDGYSAIARLREEAPELALIAYTADASEFARASMRKHRVPLVVKQGDSTPLVDLIRREAARG